MSLDGQYQLQQQTGWGNACSQPDWQQFPQSPSMGSPDSWGSYSASGVSYVPEAPRVPPMYHPGLAEPGYSHGQHPQLAADGYTWGKNLLDASNYMGSFGNHASTVARRNERERNRVRHINSTFDNLRQHLPCSNKKKKLSKVDTLRTAIKYINHLQNILGKDMKPLTQHIKQESDGSSPCSKRQSLDSSTASTTSLDNTAGQGEEEEEELEDSDVVDDSCSSPGASSTPAPFQWPST